MTPDQAQGAAEVLEEAHLGGAGAGKDCGSENDEHSDLAALAGAPEFSADWSSSDRVSAGSGAADPRCWKHDVNSTKLDGQPQVLVGQEP